MTTIETRQCPRCPAWMIRHPTGNILTSEPPKIEMEWWCGCGHRELAAPANSSMVADQTYEWWQAVNRQRVREEDEQQRAGQPWWRRLFGA